jgi:ATPase subunit of ABC transporter with duplicated ATPase domains
LNVQNLSASIDGEVLFKNVDLNMAKGIKLYYFLKILMQRPLLRNIKRKTKKLTGSFDWGVTTTNQAYLPVDNHSYFENDLSLVDWLKQKKNVMRLIFVALVK